MTRYPSFVCQAFDASSPSRSNDTLRSAASLGSSIPHLVSSMSWNNPIPYLLVWRPYCTYTRRGGAGMRKSVAYVVSIRLFVLPAFAQTGSTASGASFNVAGGQRSSCTTESKRCGSEGRSALRKSLLNNEIDRMRQRIGLMSPHAEEAWGNARMEVQEPISEGQHNGVLSQHYAFDSIVG